jgi:polyisoprenoid-binding protein YceI
VSRRIVGLVWLAGLVVSVSAWRHAQVAWTLAPTSTLTFDGTSTVKSWSCAAPTMTATIDATSREAGGAVLAGEKAVRTVSLSIPVAALDCTNGTMNGHMWKALEKEAHPTIEFTLSGYALAGAPGARTGELSGTLRIKGTSQPVTLPVRFSDAGGGMLRVQGSHVLRMTDYGVKPPTLMLGTMKVGPSVTVSFDLVLKS